MKHVILFVLLFPSGHVKGKPVLSGKCRDIKRRVGKWILRQAHGKCELERLSKSYQPEAVEQSLIKSRCLYPTGIPWSLVNEPEPDNDEGSASLSDRSWTCCRRSRRSNRHSSEKSNEYELSSEGYGEHHTSHDKERKGEERKDLGKKRKEKYPCNFDVDTETSPCRESPHNQMLRNSPRDQMHRNSFSNNEEKSFCLNCKKRISSSSRQFDSIDDVIDVVLCHKAIKDQNGFRLGLEGNINAILNVTTNIAYITRTATTPYDPENPQHEQALLQLWQLLKPNTILKSRRCNQWQDIGFQGVDPATDFRGAGILGLQTLLYFASSFNSLARRVLEEASYSFAITGINITAWLLNWLLLRKKVKRPLPVVVDNNNYNNGNYNSDDSYDYDDYDDYEYPVATTCSKCRSRNSLPNNRSNEKQFHAATTSTNRDSASISGSTSPSRSSILSRIRSRKTDNLNGNNGNMSACKSGHALLSTFSLDRRRPRRPCSPILKRRSRTKQSFSWISKSDSPPSNFLSFFYQSSKDVDDALDIFNLLYVFTFIRFHSFWIESGPATILEFPVIAEHFRRQLRFPKNLELVKRAVIDV